jgi:hypothetical protein
MVKKNEKLVLKCEAAVATRRYLKYKLPGELFEDEEPVVLFSGRHVYLHKGDGGDGVKQIVIMLGSEEVAE